MSSYLKRAKRKAREMPQRKDKRRAARGILADLRAHITNTQFAGNS